MQEAKPASPGLFTKSIPLKEQKPLGRSEKGVGDRQRLPEGLFPFGLSRHSKAL